MASDREERDQAHERPDLQMLGRPALDPDHVVIEAVDRVPHADLAAEAVDRVRDGHEMLEELGGDRLVGRPGLRELERDRQHVETEQTHPGGSVGLLEPPALAQVGPAAIEHADVVQAEEAPLKRVAALGVLAVDPPGEVEQQLVKDLFEKVGVGLRRSRRG